MEGGINIKNIDDKTMEKITGGASAAGIALIITAVVVFISGLISGYTNPERCDAK